MQCHRTYDKVRVLFYKESWFILLGQLSNPIALFRVISWSEKFNLLNIFLPL